MTASNLAKQDGATQSFTRTMYLCYSAANLKPAAASADTGRTLKPFLVQPGTRVARPSRDESFARRAIRYFFTGLVTG